MGPGGARSRSWKGFLRGLRIRRTLGCREPRGCPGPSFCWSCQHAQSRNAAVLDQPGHRTWRNPGHAEGKGWGSDTDVPFSVDLRQRLSSLRGLLAWNALPCNRNGAWQRCRNRDAGPVPESGHSKQQWRQRMAVAKCQVCLTSVLHPSWNEARTKPAPPSLPSPQRGASSSAESLPPQRPIHPLYPPPVRILPEYPPPQIPQSQPPVSQRLVSSL